MGGGGGGKNGLNARPPLCAYGHNLLAFERNARWCKFTPGCKFATENDISEMHMLNGKCSVCRRQMEQADFVVKISFKMI